MVPNPGKPRSRIRHYLRQVTPALRIREAVHLAGGVARAHHLLRSGPADRVVGLECVGEVLRPVHEGEDGGQD
jgi:hypothetical protein